MPEPFDDAWVEVGRFATPRDADQHALVLVAAGMAARIVRSDAAVGLQVAAPDALTARRELAAYARENRPLPPTGLRPLPIRDGILGVLGVWLALVSVEVAAERMIFDRDWMSAGALEAGLVTGGQWWRTITALALHADLGHLSSNLIAATVLGLFLAQFLGSGLAWLAILVAGATGNGLNAFLQPADHTAIGASTAVFGAIGLLAALMLGVQRNLWRRGLRRWAPLAAGVMLLAFLGVEGEHIDIGAHVAGLAAGAAIGLALSPAVPHLAQRWNAALGGAAVALFIAAWALALGAPQ